MTRVVKFIEFLNELNDYGNDNEKHHAPYDKYYLSVSPSFREIIKNLRDDDYKVVDLLWKLVNGVYYKNLIADPVNYLNLENDNTISFLKSRYFNEQDEWTTTRRERTKATKILRLIYNEEFLKTAIVEKDIEAFSNKLSAMKNEIYEVIELRGDEILRAYNYKGELHIKFGLSCANFKQRGKWDFGNYDEPTLEQFDIYTHNPENCAAAVVISNEGVIMGRISFQQGIQVFDSGERKKGQFYTIWGNYYGVGGRGGKYDTMIKDYLKKKYNAVSKQSNIGCFIISIETRFDNYCPFDSMYVSFKDNLLSDRETELPNGKYPNWINTYHAICPYGLVEQRKKEESR